ncbi:MAG: Grx4 family monothiol glutaredoxin [Wolbachia sp.]
MNNFEQIKKDIAENDVVLYMKGTYDFPQCGFSGLIVSILKKLNVKFKCINVLENDEIRQSIKSFSDWPTIPQLYIKGEFVGGCDITREMYENGELQNLLKEKKITQIHQEMG